MRFGIVRFALVLLIVVASILLPRPKAQAQHNATMYFMRDLPLVNTLNPAFQPNAGSIYIGLPVLSSLYLDGGISAKGISLNNLNSAQPNLRRLVENVAAYEGGYGNIDVNLFNLGILVYDMYFTLDVTTKAHAQASVPGDLIKMAWYGNAPYVGQALSLEGLGGKTEVYTEIALGFSKEVVRNTITLGGKIKGLLGHAYTDTYLGKNSFVYTDPETWNITVGITPDMNIDGFSSNVPRNGAFNTDTFKLKLNSYMPTVTGGGVGVDAGFEIKGEKLTASGSILNLGAINWKDATHVESANGSQVVTFRGVQAGEGNIVQQLKDSLLNIAKLRSSTKNAVRWIDPTITFGASYLLHENFTAGALAAMTISKYNSYPLFALSVNTQKFPINGSLAYSYSNRYHNLGLGLLFGRRGLQFHFICDNTLAVNYRNTRQTNVRMGLNLLLGEPKNTGDRKKTWQLLSTTPEESPKAKKPIGPLNPAPTDTPTKAATSKAPLNAASQEAAPKRSSQGTLSSPAGEEAPKPKAKSKKTLN